MTKTMLGARMVMGSHRILPQNRGTLWIAAVLKTAKGSSCSRRRLLASKTTLYSGFGSRQVSTIYKTGDTFSVIIEFSDKANWTPAILPDVRIRNDRANWCQSAHLPASSARQAP